MKITKTILTTGLATVFAFSALGAQVAAHVVVKPAEVTPSTYQTFTMGVPNEREVAVTALKLVIPKGVSSVTPTVKQGWSVSTEKTGEGETAFVSAITWSGGSIEAGLRDDFTFSAKTPDAAGDVEWKTYQTYADGVTVSWDKKEEGGHEEESETSGPASITKIAAAAEAEGDDESAVSPSANNNADTALFLAVASLLASGYAVWSATRRK